MNRKQTSEKIHTEFFYCIMPGDEFSFFLEISTVGGGDSNEI